MKSLVALAFLCFATPAIAKGTAPEDILKGQIIISDKPLPLRWNSVGGYVSTLRSMNRTTLWYDKKTGKLRIEYAAFFAQPLDDVQVNFDVFDITGGGRELKTSTENFMRKGDRVLFNAVTFDKDDIPMNRKYMLAIESKHRLIATGQFILRGEAEQYSGKVTFTDDEVKDKKSRDKGSDNK